MGLTDILNTARDAMTAQTFGLTVTGQNVANVNTPGYVRRQALLETRDNTTFGVLRFDLQPGGYSWEFLPVAGSTGYSDSGTATCH